MALIVLVLGELEELCVAVFVTVADMVDVDRGCDGDSVAVIVGVLPVMEGVRGAVTVRDVVNVKVSVWLGVSDMVDVDRGCDGEADVVFVSVSSIVAESREKENEGEYEKEVVSEVVAFVNSSESLLDRNIEIENENDCEVVQD